MEGDEKIGDSVGNILTFQSTPSAWRETTTDYRRCRYNVISIHSLRMEGDPETGAILGVPCIISIHSLRMEGDSGRNSQSWQIQISIHSLRMEGDRNWKSTWRNRRISIHSLRMEGDYPAFLVALLQYHFNPLPPHGGRRHTAIYYRHQEYFNPLPPHGGRQRIPICTVRHFEFQSTPSAWRETAKLHRKAFFISPILVQSCKKGCKRLHSAPEKMVFFEKREKNLVRNLQHLSVRL